MNRSKFTCMQYTNFTLARAAFVRYLLVAIPRDSGYHEETPQLSALLRVLRAETSIKWSEEQEEQWNNAHEEGGRNLLSETAQLAFACAIASYPDGYEDTRGMGRDLICLSAVVMRDSTRPPALDVAQRLLEIIPACTAAMRRQHRKGRMCSCNLRAYLCKIGTKHEGRRIEFDKQPNATGVMTHLKYLQQCASYEFNA